MAKKLENLEPRKPGPAPKYPFAEWFDGNAWLLVRGKDYRCKDASMRCLLRVWAKREGIKLRISTRKDGLAIQAILNK